MRTYAYVTTKFYNFFSPQLHHPNCTTPTAPPSTAKHGKPPSVDTSHRLRCVLISVSPVSSSFTGSRREGRQSALAKKHRFNFQLSKFRVNHQEYAITWHWFWGGKGNVSGETEVVNHSRWRFVHDLSNNPCFMNRQGEIWPRYLCNIIQIIFLQYPPVIKCG